MNLKSLLLIVCASAAVFVLALAVPWWLSGGLSYVLLVIIALYSGQGAVTIGTAALGTALTLGAHLRPNYTGVPDWVVLAHCMLWIAAIWVTALAILRRKIVQQQSARFLDLSQDLGCIADFHGRLKRINPAFERTLGVTAHESLDSSYLQRIHPDDKVRVAEELRKLLQGSPRRFEVRYRRERGDYIWIAWSAVPEEKEGLIYAVGRDITPEKLAEAASRESEDRFRLLVEETKDYAMYLLDRGGNVVSWNAGAARMKGYQAAEILGRHFSVFFVEEDVRSGKPAEALKIAETAGKFEEEGLRVRKDGSRFWANVVISSLRTEAGDLRGFTEVIHDLTERRHAQEQLRQTQRFAERIISAVPDMIYIYGFDPDRRRIVYINKSGAKFFGYTQEEIMNMEGDFLTKTLHPDDCLQVPGVRERVAYAKDDEVIETEFRRKHADGCWHWVHNRDLVFSRTGSGVPKEVLCAAVDVTERRQTEEALRATESELRRNHASLRSLAARLITTEEQESARLARELHDDLNQRLTILAIEAAKVEKQIATAPNAAAERLRWLQDQLGNVSEDIRLMSHRLHPATLEHLGLAAALEAECNAFSIREKIPVELDTGGLPERIPPEVALCLYRIAQESFKNVAKHARASMVQATLRSQDNGIWLVVADDGIGFNTEWVGAQAGLGLISIRERARVVQGHISIDSRPGAGTRVSVFVPLQRNENS